MEVVSLERVVAALILIAGLQFAAAAPGAVTAVPEAVPASAAVTAHELATAQGTVVIREAPAGWRSVACRDLVVEARGGLHDDLIGLTHAATDPAGVCRYALSVPAQSAVSLHLRPELVDAARSTAAGANAFGANAPGTNVSSAPTIAAAGPERASSGSVQLRFRIIAPTSYFFAPGEQKDVSLTY